MSKIEELKKIILELNISENVNSNSLLNAIKPYISDKLNRLEYLLWEKDEKYEGPLYDGYQENEWISISILIGIWFMEIYQTVKLNKKNIQQSSGLVNQNIDELIDNFFSKQNISILSCKLIHLILDMNLVPMNNTQKQLILISLMNSQTLLVIQEGLEKNVDKIKNLVNNVLNSCFNCCNTDDDIQNISENVGTQSIMFNKILHSKAGANVVALR